MFTQEDVNIIKNELPTSAIMEIHRKTGISRPTIYRFLKGEKIRSRFQERIYLAALKIIEQDKIRTEKIKKQRKRILKHTLLN
ncbi:MAG: hypothetical protein AB7O73_00625 [Bacteroidia bacterium]